MGEHEHAIQHLRHCLKVSDPGESHVRKAYALLVNSLVQIDEHKQALAIVYGEMGRLDLAELQWREALDEAPTYSAGRLGLVDALIQQGKLIAAEIEIERMRADDELRPNGMILAARLAERRGEPERARSELQAAMDADPNHAEALEALCKLLFEHGQAHEAEAALRRLTELRPNDAAAFHNLGAVYLRDQRFELAVDAFQASLRLRPNATHTSALLHDAMWRLNTTKPDNDR